MKSFLDKINYSSSNEDGRSEIKALKIDEKDSVLCITGSGARPLDLLIRRPASLVSIDFNPAQNFLLELKMKAIERLAYEEFLQFIGISPSQERKQIYLSFRKSLSPEAKIFWDSNLKMMQRGVIYQGGWEKYFRQLSRMVCMARPRMVKKLFGSPSIREQVHIWNSGWNNREWKVFIHLLSSRVVWKYFFRDPGFYRFVPDHFSIPAYNAGRFNLAFEHILVTQSPYAHLLFFGKYDPEGPLPLHLQKENYATIKNNLTKIQIVTGSLGNYLEMRHRRRFDKFSLSDFSSYTGWNAYSRVWSGVVKTAAEGAIVCERQFLVKRGIPRKLSGFFWRDYPLEEELGRTDDSFFFTFIVAKVMRRRNE